MIKRRDLIAGAATLPLVTMAASFPAWAQANVKLEGDTAKAAQKLARQLYDAFVALDASMLEINPLVETVNGKLLVLDAKMSFDSNALFRHPDIEALRGDA